MKRNLYIPIDIGLSCTVECTDLVKRGDTLDFTFKMFNKGTLKDLTGQAVTLNIEKPDGKIVEAKANINTSTVTASVGVQGAVLAGTIEGDLKIKDTDGSISSNTFTFTVQDSVSSDILEKSQDVIASLDEVRELVLKWNEQVELIGVDADAVEALNGIKNYIDNTLPTLQNETAWAKANLSNLDAKNSTASTNITNLINKIATADDLLDKFRLYDPTNLIQQVQNNTASLSDIVQVNLRNYKDLVTNNDWSVAIEQAITDNPNAQIYIPSSNTIYNFSRKISLGKYNSLNIARGATLQSTVLMDSLIEKHNGATESSSGYTVSQYNYIGGGGTIRCEGLCDGISLGGYSHFNLENIRIYNPKSVGIDTRFIANAFAVEIVVDNVYIETESGRNEQNVIGINAKNSDGYFTKITTVNMHTGIQNNDGNNKFLHCHDWVYDTNRLSEHICYLDNYDGFWDTCCADTCTIGWLLRGSSYLDNCSLYQSPQFPVTNDCVAFSVPLGSTKLNRIYNCTITGSQNSIVKLAIGGEINKNVEIKNLVCNEYVSGGMPKKENYYISTEYAGGAANLYNFATIQIPLKQAGSAITGNFVIMPNSGNNADSSSKNMKLSFWIKAYVDSTGNYTDSNINVRITNLDNYLDGKIRVFKTTTSNYVQVKFYFVMQGTWQVINVSYENLIGGHGMYNNKPFIQQLTDNLGILLLMNEGIAFESTPTGKEITVTESRISVNNMFMNGYNIWVDSNGVPRLQSGSKTSDTSGQPLLRYVVVPTSATSVGSIGNVAFDGSYFYICIGTNSWRRVPISSW